MKIFLISLGNFDDINNRIMKYNDDLIICKKFTNNDEYTDYTYANNNLIYYINTPTIITSIKNNAVLYVNSNEYIDGIMMDDYYNSHIINMNIVEFNKISECLLNKTYNTEDVLIVFIDDSDNENNKKISLQEYNYFQERIEKFPNIYLLNEPNDVIVNIIYKYITGDNEIKQEILETYE